MNGWDAFILGLIQGLTEFLPISSSGHIELGKVLLGIEGDENMAFTVVVHGATVLSTIIILFPEILSLLKGIKGFRWSGSNQFIVKIILSTLPVIFVGLFFADWLESFFSGNLVFVGSMLIITAILLFFTYFAKPRQQDISFVDALIIGIAQMIAVLPGISRSGATIATGLLLGNKKEEVAKFSFLMVLIPIIGANFLDLMRGELTTGQIPGSVLIIGFISAFVTGLLACSWMLNIVKKGKLYYFGIYCLIVGIIAILTGII